MEKINKELRFKDNPRVITEAQQERLAEHLEELGDLSGVVYCRNNKAYAGGNQRSVYFDGCPVIITETHKEPTKTGTVALGWIEKDGERYAYREVDWTEGQFRKACVVANNDGGDWDWTVLSQWDQTDLADWGFEVTPEKDYSKSNKEIDVSDFEELMTMFFKFSKDDFIKVRNGLEKIATSPEQAIITLIDQHV